MFLLVALEIQQEWLRDMVVRFAESLSKACSPLGYIKLRKRKDNFLKFDEYFHSREEITIDAVVKHFGGNWCNDNKLVAAFLVAEGLIPTSADVEREEAVSYHRQVSILAEVEGKWFHPILTSFHHFLQEAIHQRRSRGWKGRRIRLKQRTATGALFTARKFLQSITENISDVTELQQGMVDRFLYTNSKARTSLRAFVVFFLRGRRKTFAKLDVPALCSHKGGKGIPWEKYTELLDAWTSPPPGKAHIALCGLFALLCAQRCPNMARLKVSDIMVREDGGVEVKFAKTWVEMPEEVVTVVKQVLRERPARLKQGDEGNPYLFPAAHAAGASIHPYSMFTWFREYGVRVRDMYSTALINTFRSGVQCPKAAENAFGVSSTTAALYDSLVDVRLRNELTGRMPYDEE